MAAAFIEVHTTAGMTELVNTSSIQTIRQLTKYTQLELGPHNCIEVTERYEDVKCLIRRAAEGESVVCGPQRELAGMGKSSR
jgi:hypothetical protein